MGFGAVQTLVGVTKLSELGIDISKNWLTYLIKNLGDPVDAQDAATRAYVLAQLLNYLPLAGGTMTGDIAMNTKLVTGLGAPVADNDAATKKYIDDLVALYLRLTGGTMSGAIDMGAHKITGLADPTEAQDAVTLAYLLTFVHGYEPILGTEGTEEQTQYDKPLAFTSQQAYRGGQRLTISNRYVSKLGFWLRKYNSPPGSYYFAIRKVSDDSIIIREAVGLADDLPTTVTYIEHTFATPVLVNEEVRILVEYTTPSTTNVISSWYQYSDVKASEYRTYCNANLVYVDFSAVGHDHAYIYTHVSP